MRGMRFKVRLEAGGGLGQRKEAGGQQSGRLDCDQQAPASARCRGDVQAKVHASFGPCPSPHQTHLLPTQMAARACIAAAQGAASG